MTIRQSAAARAGQVLMAALLLVGLDACVETTTYTVPVASLAATAPESAPQQDGALVSTPPTEMITPRPAPVVSTQPVVVGPALGGGSVTGEQRADYLAAVASVGCVLRDQRQYGAVEFQSGLTRAQTTELTGYYLGRGEAERLPDDPNAVRLTTGPCATG